MTDPVVLPASVLQSNGEPSILALLFAGGILRGVLTFVGSGFVGVVLMAVFQMWADDVVRNAREEWAMRTFVGIAGSAILGFIGIFLLSLTWVGAVFSVPILLVLVITAVLGQPLGAAATTGRIIGRTDPDDRWVTLMLGVLVISVLNAIPVLGPLFAGLYASCGVGELLVRGWKALS